MKIISFNVRWWTRDWKPSSEHFWLKRFKAIKKMLKSENPDIICLQEAFFPTNLMLCMCGYRFAGFSISHPILIKRSFKKSNHRFKIKMDVVDIEVEDSKITVINVHSHWNNLKFQKDMSDVNDIIEERNLPTVVCGDYNVYLPSIRNSKISWMDSVREMMGLDESEDTFINFTNPESHGAIDHFMVTKMKPVNYYRVNETYGVTRLSDHYPICTYTNM